MDRNAKVLERVSEERGVYEHLGVSLSPSTLEFHGD
jgi:hypothetical protein